MLLGHLLLPCYSDVILFSLETSRRVQKVSLISAVQSFVKCHTEGIILQRLLDQKCVIKHPDERTGKISVGRILI